MKFELSIALAFFFVMTSACDNSEKVDLRTKSPERNSFDQTLENDGSVLVVEKMSDLPLCLKSIDGRVYYIESENRLIYCKQGISWVDVDTKGDKGDEGERGITPIVATETLQPGSECAAGGSRILSGGDANRNDVLDPDEVEQTQVICNGENGLNALIRSEIIVPGGQCDTGGTLIKIGLDANRDGVLDQSEVTQTQAICNGVTGEAGINSLVLTEAIAPGSLCSAGGTRIQIGPDADGDNVLETNEIVLDQVICNGDKGDAGVKSLVETETIVKGVVCSAGGLRIKVGRDTNTNNTIDSNEIVQTQVICNGEAGASGSNALVKSEAVPFGPICQAGGTRLQFGRDTNNNGVLDASEVEHTQVICNGDVKSESECKNINFSRSYENNQIKVIYRKNFAINLSSWFKSDLDFNISDNFVVQKFTYKDLNASSSAAKDKFAVELDKIFGELSASREETDGSNTKALQNWPDCSVIPVTRITHTSKNSTKTVVDFSPGLPYIVSPILSLVDIRNTFKEKIKLSGITATIIETGNSGLAAGTKIEEGMVSIEPVPDLNLPNKFALKFVFNFTNKEQTLRLGLFPSVTYTIDGNSISSIDLHTSDWFDSIAFLKFDPTSQLYLPPAAVAP